MELHATESPSRSRHGIHCNLIATLLPALFLTLLILFASNTLPSLSLLQYIVLPTIAVTEDCNIGEGDWVHEPHLPYYTNTSCSTIHKHQNCIKNGRPDTNYLKLRWKPKHCDLPRFDAYRFLEIVRGKSMLFLGDSLMRNQMESLMCLLSKVERPKKGFYKPDEFLKPMFYKTYNFSLEVIWSPLLVAYETPVPGGNRPEDKVYKIFLDEADEIWTPKIATFDYVIISSGVWFYHPRFLYYVKDKIIWSQFDQINETMSLHAFQMALQTAFKTMTELDGFKGKVYVTTISPGHYDDGDWNSGGSCPRTMPYRSNETRLKERYQTMYNIQVEALRAAKEEGRKRGLEFKVMNITMPMHLRPDGHPDRYGYLTNERPVNDCVHWCLPGPIDMWNEYLLHLIST